MNACKMSHLSGAGMSRTRSSPRNSRRYRLTSGTAVESGEPRLTKRTARFGIVRFDPPAAAPVKLAPAESDEPDQAVHVLRRDAIGNDRSRIVVLEVKVDAVLRPRAHEIIDEIHAASGPHPAEIGIRVLGLYDDIVLQEDVAVQREIAE